MDRSAFISPDGLYRYWLSRRWDTLDLHADVVAFCMLNPSTADAERDDATIRRCVKFAREWGYDKLVVVNLFAFRSTNPKALNSAADPVGAENDRFILEAAEHCDIFVCAWGTQGSARHFFRDADVIRMLRADGHGPKLRHLGLTTGHCPRHPLYLRGDTIPKEWP